VAIVLHRRRSRLRDEFLQLMGAGLAAVTGLSRDFVAPAVARGKTAAPSRRQDRRRNFPAIRGHVGIGQTNFFSSLAVRTIRRARPRLMLLRAIRL
jgi:hypothetical protein